MQIRPILKTYYSSDEVQTLANNILRETQSLTPAHPVVKALADNLRTSYESLKTARGQSKLNTQTQKVMAADERRDLAFRAFYYYVEAWSIRLGNKHQETAQNLLLRLGKIDRQLPYMGYSRQSAELVLLFNEMSKVNAELKAFGADAWLKELKEAEDAFIDTQMDKMNEELEKKVVILSKEAKEHTLALLMALTQTLNGLVMANIDGISALNERIDQVIAEVEVPARARHSRKTSREEERV